VGPRAGLDTEGRGKILYPCRGSNLDRPVVQSVARHYTDCSTLGIPAILDRQFTGDHIFCNAISHVNVAQELLWRNNTSTHIRRRVSLGRMPSSINSALTKLLSDPQLPHLSPRSVCFACTNSQYPNKPDKVDTDVFAPVYIVAYSSSLSVIITPQLCLSEVSQRITRYYSFLGLVQTRLVLPTSLLLISSSKSKRELNQAMGAQRPAPGEFKGEMHQAVLQADEKLFIPSA
jgi:hypothetical protein